MSHPGRVSAAPWRLGMLGFRPGAGGIARVMIDLITALRQAGALVDLLLPPGDYPDLAHFVEPPVCFELDEARPARAARQLQDYLARCRPAALLGNRDRAAALLARATVRGARPPVWLRIGSDVREKIAVKNPLQRPFYRAMLQRSYRAADGLIAVSSGVADSLRALLGDAAPPIRVILNPLDRARLARLAAIPPAHPWFQERVSGGRADSVPVILGLGRLVATKDFATLLRAFAIVRRQRPARLVIFGEGRQRPALERLKRRLGLNEVVDLPGFVANPFPYLQRAALFVLSSRYEGMGNVLIEALACGTPCVATDCRSGPAEILDHGRYGALVPVGDVAALAAAMLRTLAAPPSPAMLQVAAARFDAAVSAAAYREALGGGDPHAALADPPAVRS